MTLIRAYERLDIAPDPGKSRLIGTRALGDRRLAAVFYPRGMRQDRHRHNTATFSFVASGQYTERIGRQPHDRRSSTLIFHPAGEYHAVDFESDVKILSVEFRDTGDTGHTADSLQRGSSHCGRLVAWLGTRLEREMARADSASVLAIDGIISEMLAEGSRRKVLAAERSTPKWLARATDFVHDNFTGTFSLEDVAEVAGIHPAHLSRIFRQKMGCTVGEHVRRLRFEFACHQILSTEKSLCEIALDAGFSDQSHFNRIFRNKMGMTPYGYRRAHLRVSKNARFVQDFGRR